MAWRDAENPGWLGRSQARAYSNGTSCWHRQRAPYIQLKEVLSLSSRKLSRRICLKICCCASASDASLDVSLRGHSSGGQVFSRRNWTSRRADDTPGPHALTLHLEASIMPGISEWLAVLRETRRMSRELCIAPYLRLQPQAASHIEEHNCSCDFDSRRWRRVL